MKPNRCEKPLEDGVCGLDKGHNGECGASWRPWTRANYVPAPHYYNLDHACALVNQAFSTFGCYLVGSAHDRRDFRDVDVRLILADDEYERMFGDPRGRHNNSLWSLMCASISEWLSKQSGLPVDFQIQQQTSANAQHSGRRSALGLAIPYERAKP